MVDQFLPNPEFPVSYLDYYGYLQSTSSYKEAVKKFQEQYGNLEVDGEVGPKTLRAMLVPRCGLADHIEEANVLRKWPQRDFQKDPITYFIYGFVEGISEEIQRKIHRSDWDAWEAVCGLKFLEVSSAKNADITIGVGKGRAQNFDGPSGTLAWAELPDGRNRRQLDTKYDGDENWSYKLEQNGILMQAVGRHEKGHLLGLSHSNNSTDLLAPFYNKAVYVPKAGDISEVVKRYGKPFAKDQPTTPTNPPTDEEIVTIRLKRSALDIDGYRLSKI